jgi:peroxiredoxin
MTPFMRAACKLIVTAACFVGFAAPLLADADADWRRILELDAGPREQFQNAEQARVLTVQHLREQEKTFRNFMAKYPDDPRVVDLKLRLAHLLAVRSDFEANSALYVEARKLLGDLQKSPATPQDKMADVAFARLSLDMTHVRRPLDPASRDGLLNQARKFQKEYPQDRRLGALFAVVATLYDSQPKTKQALLLEAVRLTSDPALKQQIDDDLKRIGMLGKPVALKFTSVQGESIDVEKYRGKVVMIYFFANWSPPSMLGLREIRGLNADLAKEKFQTLGISLDSDREKLLATLKTEKIDWPVAFDGKGWESPLVRPLGINVLPTAWILDRRGNLRALNAIDNTEAVIRALLNEK